MTFKKSDHKFKSLEEALKFVHENTEKEGFCLYTRQSLPTKCYLTCVCSRSKKESYYTLKSNQRKNSTIKPRKTTSQRQNCQYSVIINLIEDHWVPCYSNKEHNHARLYGMEILDYPRYRKLNLEQKNVLEILGKTDASNASIAAQLSAIGTKPVLRTDVKNYRSQRNNAIDSGEDKETLRPLIRLLDDKNYITSYKLDDENRLTHLFFAHQSVVKLVSSIRKVK